MFTYLYERKSLPLLYYSFKIVSGQYSGTINNNAKISHYTFLGIVRARCIFVYIETGEIKYDPNSIKVTTIYNKNLSSDCKKIMKAKLN